MFEGNHQLSNGTLGLFHRRKLRPGAANVTNKTLDYTHYHCFAGRTAFHLLIFMCKD